MARASNRSGATLMELMVAMLILSVGILALVSVQSYSAKARKLNQNHLLASQRAGSQIADIQERALQDFAQDFSQAETALANRMFLTVQQEANWNGSPSLKAVTVTVSYPSQGQEKGGRVRVWTLLREPD